MNTQYVIIDKSGKFEQFYCGADGFQIEDRNAIKYDSFREAEEAAKAIFEESEEWTIEEYNVHYL